jgi:ATP-binding cassette subfamily B protein
VTATGNAAFTIQNMFIWNVLPPCVATLGAVAFLMTVDPLMTASLVVVAAILLYGLYRLAAAGATLHMGFADKAAGVEGELTDVVSNIMLVRSFGAIGRERRRFRETVGEEMAARRTSLLYLEKIRFLHAALTVALTVGLLALGDRAVAARRDKQRPGHPGLHARDDDPLCDTRPRRGPGRCHAAYRPALSRH